MKIILFNTFHNGDLFFTKEFIRAIVKNNPAHKFHIACRQFFSLFSDIENLEVSERPNDVDTNIQSENIKVSKRSYIHNDVLYINVSGSLQHEGHAHATFICTINVECLNKYYKDNIDEANTLEIEPKLVFNSLKQEEFLPTIFTGMKLSDLPSEVQSRLTKPCIYYYNMKALTSDVLHGDDDDKNIEAVAVKYPSYTVIVPKETKIKKDNIISLYDLNIREVPDGKNLLLYAYVASFCSIIVTKETGGALIILNKDMMQSNIEQYIIFYHSEGKAKELKKAFGETIVDNLNNLGLKDNKHIIPLSKYDSETLLGEIEKIGPISPPNLDPISSGGRRISYSTKKNKRNLHINKRYRKLARRKTNKRIRNKKSFSK